MIHGLMKFRDYFKDYKDRYLLIGGSACDIFVESQGERFRATNDLDIVLCTETLTKEFTEKFWEFVKEGGCRIKQKADGKRQFYRFDKPSDRSFPEMFEREEI